MPELRYDAYVKSDDFTRRYNFPGGHVPTITHLVNSITNSSNGSLIVDRMWNIRPHYAKSLTLWRGGFPGSLVGPDKTQVTTRKSTLGYG